MKTLIVVDVQEDFMPGGPLAARNGREVVPAINALMDEFDYIVATQDWHPPDHGSFAVNHPGHKPGEVIKLGGLDQILWPPHCVQDTPGAKFAEGLRKDRFDEVFKKGSDPRIDSYSGFYDNGHVRSTGLTEHLQSKGIDEVSLCGVATDYCVKFTTLDALRDGFKTHLHIDACRGVEANPGDMEAAIQEMRKAGAVIEKR